MNFNTIQEVKCFWQDQCPYYEQITSYDTEVLKCKNTDCPLFSIEEESEVENETA